MINIGNGNHQTRGGIMSNRIIIDSSRDRTKSIPGKGTGGYGARAGIPAQAALDAVPGGEGPGNEDARAGALLPDAGLWGNDRALDRRLDREILAERRLFVRVRHVQKITCDVIYEDIDKEPVRLSTPFQFMTVDISAAGIGIVCDREIETGKILGIRMALDRIPYDIKCRVIYCIPMDDKYRAGLKIAEMDRNFMQHIKIFVARASLTNEYAAGE